MLPRNLRVMARTQPRASSSPNSRLSAVVRQMASSSSSSSSPAAATAFSSTPAGETLPAKPDLNGNEPAPSVLFRSDGHCRTYILNRPVQLNALDYGMLKLLRPAIQEWEKSPRCHLIVGSGNGRAFCAGGDVKSMLTDVKNQKPEGPMKFFKEEFELDFALALLSTPYIAILDGITMGGGVGLSINAKFRVATENTVFGMPETKIGYSPDVGASFFLPRLDGGLGAYLALTGDSLRGREVFEAGIATHYVSSHRLPSLLERLSGMVEPSVEAINETLDEFYMDRVVDEAPSTITGTRRAAIDYAFGKDSVEEIFDALRAMQNNGEHPESEWAGQTLQQLDLRSPTSLRVTMENLQRGRFMTLGQALKMESGVASAFASGASPDFGIGVQGVLVDKTKQRLAWSPSTLEAIPLKTVQSHFYDPDSPYLKAVPKATYCEDDALAVKTDPMSFSLPSEAEIGRLVRGEHPSSSSTAFTQDELIERSGHVWKKAGVAEKVKDVIQRRCERVPRSGMEEAHLRWIH